MRLKIFLLSLISFLSISFLDAQGCSDAGICTIGAIKSPGKQMDSLSMNAISVGLTYGAGFEKTSILSPYIQYERNIGSSFSLLAKLTAAFTNGDLGNNSGLGDIYIAGSYMISKGYRSSFSLIGGVKIPLNNADGKNEDGIPLPMEYQTSLGTVDLILGIGAGFGRNFEVSVAAQVPVVNNNENGFFPFLFENGNANEFHPTYKFVRQADILGKLAYNIKLNQKLGLKPNLLAIYHTSNDKFTDLNGIQQEINESAGLTLNIGVTATFTANEYSQFEFLVAAPAVVRKSRPDGLTRSFVAGVQYRMGF